MLSWFQQSIQWMRPRCSPALCVHAQGMSLMFCMCFFDPMFPSSIAPWGHFPPLLLSYKTKTWFWSFWWPRNFKRETQIFLSPTSGWKLKDGGSSCWLESQRNEGKFHLWPQQENRDSFSSRRFLSRIHLRGTRTFRAELAEEPRLARCLMFRTGFQGWLGYFDSISFLMFLCYSANGRSVSARKRFQE